MILDSYITSIKLLRKFLNKKGYCIDIVTIQNIYEKHPLPNSIRALSDTLDTLHIPNMVYRISTAQLNEVPTPAIVFLRKSKDLFYIFDDIKEGNKVVLQFTTQQLLKKQMNQVTGGGAFFKCECTDGLNNSPCVPEWTGFYIDTDAMYAEIEKRCQKGGSCNSY